MAHMLTRGRAALPAARAAQVRDVAVRVSGIGVGAHLMRPGASLGCEIRCSLINIKWYTYLD